MTDAPDAARLRAAIEALLEWFDRNRRDLPWRNEPRDPYRVWISEAMLQQTQVATVIPYFERWLRRFPDVSALATAPLDDALKLWEGLGYYARARNLHRAAQVVAALPGGRLPDTLEGLLSLPGIGRYTAGAIASLAHNRDAPALDGNVKRVIARLFAIGADWPSAWPAALGARPDTLRTRDDLLWALDEALLTRGRAGAFNEAMMELGATVCLPRAPDCGRCPLRTTCAALATGDPSAYPPRARKPAVPARRAYAAALVDPSGRLLVAQRPAHGLLGGLWELPGTPLLDVMDFDPEAAATALTRSLEQRLGVRATARGEDFALAITHTFTHFRLTRHAAVVRLSAAGADPIPDSTYAAAQWVDADRLASLAFAGPDRKLLVRLPGLIDAGKDDLGRARLKGDVNGAHPARRIQRKPGKARL